MLNLFKRYKDALTVNNKLRLQKVKCGVHEFAECSRDIVLQQKRSTKLMVKSSSSGVPVSHMSPRLCCPTKPVLSIATSSSMTAIYYGQQLKSVYKYIQSIFAGFGSQRTLHDIVHETAPSTSQLLAAF